MQKKITNHQMLSHLNTPGDAVHPQLTTGVYVYWALFFFFFFFFFLGGGGGRGGWLVVI